MHTHTHTIRFSFISPIISFCVLLRLGRNTPGLYDRERIKGRPPELRRNWPIRTHFTLSYTPRPLGAARAGQRLRGEEMQVEGRKEGGGEEQWSVERFREREVLVEGVV